MKSYIPQITLCRSSMYAIQTKLTNCDILQVFVYTSVSLLPPQ